MRKQFWIVSLIPSLLLLTWQGAVAQTRPTAHETLKTAADQAVGGSIAVVGAAVAVTVILVHNHHAHMLKGCVASDSDGLVVNNEGDKRNYALTGDTDGIKVGERVKLSGKRKKVDATHKQFVVGKLRKDYGACKQ